MFSAVFFVHNSVYYAAFGFRNMEALKICVKLLSKLLLVALALWLFTQTVANKEWNIFTIVMLTAYMTCETARSGLLAVNLCTEWRAIPNLNSLIITEASEPLFFEELRPDCRLCRGGIGEENLNFQEIARSLCKQRPHYFHD